MQPLKLPRVGLLFNHDWDAEAFGRLGQQAHFDSAGFDLLSFPSNAALVTFDMLRFAASQARRGARRGWSAVLSHHEQFGALAAALVAEHLGLPGATPESILAAQHKLHARRVLQAVARDGAFYLFSMRVAPVIPFPVINPLMGLTAMRLRTVFGVSLLGMLAGSVAYAWAGAALAQAQALPDLASPGLLAGLLALALLPWGARAAWRRCRAATGLV